MGVFLANSEDHQSRIIRNKATQRRLQELRSHVLILSDPNGSAHVGWAEMYDGRFIPALKTALEAGFSWAGFSLELTMTNCWGILGDPGGFGRKMTMKMVEFSRSSAVR